METTRQTFRGKTTHVVALGTTKAINEFLVLPISCLLTVKLWSLAQQKPLEKWWLEDKPFFLGFGNFSRDFAVKPWEVWRVDVELGI